MKKTTYYAYVNSTNGNEDRWELLLKSNDKAKAKEAIAAELDSRYGPYKWADDGQYSLVSGWTQYVVAIIKTEPMEDEKARIQIARDQHRVEFEKSTRKNESESRRQITQEGGIKSTATVNPDKWQEMMLKNVDPYGRGVMTYAERWATLMEQRIAAGEALSDIADTTSHEADIEGITGFMYGAAISILVYCEWAHAEELRRWHNHGYGVEDAKGVVNPAVLHIK